VRVRRPPVSWLAAATPGALARRRGLDTACALGARASGRGAQLAATVHAVPSGVAGPPPRRLARSSAATGGGAGCPGGAPGRPALGGGGGALSPRAPLALSRLGWACGPHGRVTVLPRGGLAAPRVLPGGCAAPAVSHGPGRLAHEGLWACPRAPGRHHRRQDGGVSPGGPPAGAVVSGPRHPERWL
jgi:hypothetical protein